VRNDPPVEVNDAHWLLDFYSSFPEESDKDDHTERALQCLSQIQGSFAFVIYDAARRRVLASRDSNGSQPLFWGASPDGQLLFGSCLEDLSTCTPSATSFPAGILFASERTLSAYNPGDKGWVIEDEDFPGQLLSFLKSDPTHWRGVKVIPRITSKGILCGAVYKVASRAKLAF
jgi:asparagine synthetase B (glutamine-hydrolysing)